MQLNVEQYQEVASVLLRKHYGITLNDTDLCEETVVRQYVKQGARPFEVIAEHADDVGMVRVDKEGFYGIPSTSEITAEDEEAALREVGLVETKSPLAD